MMDWSRTEGEVLFFSDDGALKRMLSALCGVSGEADPMVRPRLCIADDDARARQQCLECARVNRSAVLLLGDVPPGNASLGVHHLPRPFLFSDFTDLLREIFAESKSQTQPSARQDSAVARLLLDRDGWVSFGENRCHLSPAEAQILQMLLQSAPTPVPRDHLAQIFRGKRGNGVDVYISYLRSKLRELTPHVGILSVRGQGYALVGGETAQK